MPSKKPTEKVEALQPSPAPEETKPAVEKQRYYRIRKISGHLAEILEVEIDETVMIPTRASKQDSWQYLIDKVTQLVYPSTDAIAKRKREEARAALAKSSAGK